MLRTLGTRSTRHVRGVAAALVVGLLAVVLPLVVPTGVNAAGEPGTIQAGPDIQTVSMGTGAQITVWLEPFINPAPAAPLERYHIAYEIAGGPADPEQTTGFSPLTPDGDGECIISSTDTTPNSSSPRPWDCTVTIPAPSTPGTSLVYFWFDSNAKFTLGNDPQYIPGSGATVAEVDVSEGRYAGPKDCDPTIDTSPRCASGAPQQGAFLDPDGTDIVAVSWVPEAQLLDCSPLRDEVGFDTVAVAEGQSAWFNCMVTSADANRYPVPGIVIDAENFSDGFSETTSWTNDGANDPDGGSNNDGATQLADYDDVCITGENGRCQISIPAGELNQLGPAAICFWVDGIDAYTPRPSTNPEAEQAKVPDRNFRPNLEHDAQIHNGSRCDGEGSAASGNPLKIDVDQPIFRTDKVLIRWEPPLFLRGGTDAQPENTILEPGVDGRLTATAYDQFGGRVPNVVVRFEQFSPSKSQWKTSSRVDPDFLEGNLPHCVTDGDGNCSIFYSAPTSGGGSDYFCVWTQRITGEPGPPDGHGMERPAPGETGSPFMTGGGTSSTCGPTPGGSEAEKTATREKYWEGHFDATANDGAPSPADDAFDIVRIEWRVPPPPSPPPPPPPPPVPTATGYWLVADDGGVFAFGDAGFYGSTGDIKLNKPIVTTAATPSGLGYWLVASDGGVFAFGDAGFYGSTGDIKLNKPIVGMTPTKSGKGYWLVASDGGIFTFGDAAFHGSTGNLTLNKPIIAMAATPAGGGYWLMASDGGMFTFGDAAYFGSGADSGMTSPFVAIAATPTGEGYWLVTNDGTMFTFGDASYFGAPAQDGTPLNQPLVGMAVTPSGEGYWLVATDGGMFAYGDAEFYGSTGSIALNRPILGMAPSVKLKAR